MHPLLVEYVQRFKKPFGYNYSQFFTQLDLASYPQGLPYLFKIEMACVRLHQALKNRQKVCIYADYDTDAVTASSSLYWALVYLGFEPGNISTYAPDRFIEGYGMNPEAIQKLSLINDLIVSVDCGINSTEEAKIVKSSPNCDLIITDHHHLQGEIPDCVAVLNPRLASYYHQNPEKLELDFSLLKTDLDKDFLDYWLSKVRRKPEDYVSNSAQFLSESVTGVGVAWFFGVWFGYFLEELENFGHR